MPGQRKGQRMTDAEKKELPTSLFILSGTNCFRRAAVWFVRWFVFEWVIILTIIGKIIHLGSMKTMNIIYIRINVILMHHFNNHDCAQTM